jgi:hypothetical protein
MLGLLYLTVALHRCNAEMRNCALTDEYDETGEEQISIWNRLCSTRTTEHITTPTVTLATEIFRPEVCGQANTMCRSWSYTMGNCATAESLVSSCRCDLDIVAKEAVCKSLDDQCFRRPANVSTWAVYSSCPTARAFLTVCYN